jgi:hypothetical protein
MFTLPAGYRPSYIRHLSVLTGTATASACILYVYADGTVVPHASCNAAWISIEVSFRP